MTLSVSSWDHHSNPNQHIFQSYRHVLPGLDTSITALVTDLEERGFSEDVLVVVLGEFGRTPKVSYPGSGRKHLADAGCVLMASGGVKMGQVIGESDSRAKTSRPFLARRLTIRAGVGWLNGDASQIPSTFATSQATH